MRNDAPSFVMAISWSLRRHGWIRGKTTGDRPIDFVEALHACYRRCDLVLRSQRREVWGLGECADRCRHCRLTLTDIGASPQDPSYRNRPPQSLTACGTASGSRSRGHHRLVTSSFLPAWPYDGFIPVPSILRYRLYSITLECIPCLPTLRPARLIVWP